MISPFGVDPLVANQTTKLVAPDGSADDRFGGPVAIDGDTVVVGAAYDDVGAKVDQGSAYVFARNQGGGDNWGLVKQLTVADGAAGDEFGYVAITGDIVVVGARRDDVAANANQGSAYVFARNQGGADNWGQVKQLTAPDGKREDRFGPVAISGDIIVVGARFDDVGTNVDQGSAYIFARNQGGVDNWGLVKQLVAADGAAGDRFGYVAMDGDMLVVGAPGDNVGANADQGSAYIFARNQGGVDNWGLVKQLTVADGAASDSFSIGVAISGDNIVIGADGADVGANIDQGSAYVFARNQGGVDHWGLVKQLTAGDGAVSDYFGAPIAISGDRVVIGAEGDNVGDNVDQGSVYVFACNQGGVDHWGLVEQLTATDGAANDLFGEGVAVDSAIIVIGAPQTTVGVNTGQGSAYVFSLSGPELSLSKAASALTPSPGQTLDYIITLNNSGTENATNIVLSDTLPAGLTLAGPVALDPPSSGTASTPPNLLTGLTLAPGQIITVTVPVHVNVGQPAGTVIINTAVLASAEVPTPLMASAVITAADAPLTARDDFALTAVDTPVTIYTLGNDGDPNGDALTITAVGTPLSGTVSVAGPALVYTPTLGFLGTDVFTYTVSTSAESASAAVTVRVAAEVFRLYLPLVVK